MINARLYVVNFCKNKKRPNAFGWTLFAKLTKSRGFERLVRAFGATETHGKQKKFTLPLENMFLVNEREVSSMVPFIQIYFINLDILLF